MAAKICPQSPRTAEAIKRLGILETQIQPRTLASFAEENLLLEFQELRKKHYDRKREELINEIIKERETIVEEIQREEKRKAAQRSHLAENQNQHSARDFAAREKTRLKKLEEAQKKELQQFIEYEIKMQEIALMNEAKRSRELALEERRQREKVEHAKEWERQRKLKEEQRYQEELAELRRQEDLAQKAFEEAQRMKRKELEEQKALKALAQQKELERRRKQDEREAMLLKMQEEQERNAHERELTLQEREKKKVEAIAKKRQQEIETHRAQAEALKTRVQQAKLKEQTLLEQKRRDFERKAAKAERRRAQFEAERNAQIQKAIDESQEHMRKVKAILQASIEKYELRKQAFAEKEAAEQQHQAELQRERQREAQRVREIERMQNLERVEAIQQQQRAHEYRCMKIREQIELENQTTEAVKRRSKKLIEQRRKLAMDARRKKEELTAKLEHIKLNGQFNPQTIMREFGLTMEDRPQSKYARPASQKPVVKRSSPSKVPGCNQVDELDADEERRLNRTKSNATLRPVRTLKSLRLALLHYSRSAPKIGPVSRESYKRLVECGSAYDINMSWLKKPQPEKKKPSLVMNEYDRDDIAVLLT